jgi:DNA mismatch repair protein MutL
MAFAHVEATPGDSQQPSEAVLEQLALPGEAQLATGEQPGALVPPARALPVLRVLGQASALFIIAEGPEGVYMVDQHAAHERVLYDQLCAQLEQHQVPVQSLLEPALVELSAAQMEGLAAADALLRDLGFEIEAFGVSTALVRAVPAMFAGKNVAEAVTALLDDIASGKERSEQRDRSLATMACKAAVKAGQPLGMEEMRALVQRLELTGRPRTCPHGRPTMILLSTSALERQFGRR